MHFWKDVSGRSPLIWATIADQKRRKYYIRAPLTSIAAYTSIAAIYSNYSTRYIHNRQIEQETFACHKYSVHAHLENKQCCIYRSVPDKRPLLGKRPPSCFCQVSVSAHEPGKRPPKIFSISAKRPPLFSRSARMLSTRVLKPASIYRWAIADHYR